MAISAPTVKAKEILGYFLHNPEAADTLEGVSRWRLMEEQIHRNVEEINDALSWLVAQGFLLTESVPGSDTIFRLHPEKAAEAARFLAERKGGPGE